MALLSEDKRKEIFKALGLGEYNKANIKKLQAKYMARKSDADGIYGTQTDNLLRHLYNCHKYLNKDNFSPTEFKCECNGRYCSGYPTYMKPAQLTNLQTIRNHYKKPMTITSGMRCKGYNNSIGGSISNSKHLLGQATDFYMAGITDTLANRKAFIKYAKNLPNTTYIYGNGINIYGNGVSAPYMGNAIHYDTSNGEPKPTPTPAKGKLVVDGIGGTATVKAMQKFFDTTQDGVISGQNLNLKKYYPSLIAVKGGGGGSPTIEKLQWWVGGKTCNGVIGVKTVKAWQKKIGVEADGVFGKASMKKWQEYLNTHDKPVYPPKPTPTPTPTKDKYKVIDVSYWQGSIDWKKVKADGVVGAIIRYADGDTLDSKFAYNMKNAKANGIHIGSYIFSRAKTKAQAEAEATRLFNACKKYSPDLPLYIDLEAKGLEKYADTVAQAYLNKIKALGGKGGVYANLNWWNNYLTKTAKGSFAMWLAQYNDKMTYKPASAVGMWQYSSSGSVKGISGRVDMNWLYQKYWEDKPTPTPEKKGYQGTFPSITLTKTNAQVKADACDWATRIAKNNDFHYGSNEHAYHNGCYFCGTNDKFKKGHGMKMWQYTYCCNPFVGAAWAHGGGDAEAYRLCHNCNSWGFAKNDSPSYEKSDLFNKLGHPDKSKLKAGDVLCADSHVVLYIGNGKIAEAATRDDNVIGSKKWNDSIRVTTLTDSRYKGLPRAYRYNGKVNCDRVLSYGELSDRVADLRRFLVWYGYKIGVTRFFNTATLEAVKDFQEKELGKGQGDGLVGSKTIEAMKKVKK